jgi:hypothetical protein
MITFEIISYATVFGLGIVAGIGIYLWHYSKIRRVTLSFKTINMLSTTEVVSTSFTDSNNWL